MHLPLLKYQSPIIYRKCRITVIIFSFRTSYSSKDILSTSLKLKSTWVRDGSTQKERSAGTPEGSRCFAAVDIGDISIEMPETPLDPSVLPVSNVSSETHLFGWCYGGKPGEHKAPLVVWKMGCEHFYKVLGLFFCATVAPFLNKSEWSQVCWRGDV